MSSQEFYLEINYIDILYSLRLKNLNVVIHFCKSIDEPVKNIPAMQAVIRHARVAAASARKPTEAISFFLEGAIADMPPTNIAIDARCVNPQSAYVVITIVLGFVIT